MRYCLIAWLLLCLAGPAAADQTDPRLDELFAKLHETAEAEEAKPLEQAIWAVWLESNSPTVDLLMQRSIQAMNERRFDEALGLLNVVVEVKPDYAEGWNKRATLFYLLGRFGDSIADVEKTLALEPRHFGALSGLGLIYAAQDKEAEALDAYRRALEVHPHLPNALSEVERLTDIVEGRKI